MDKFTKYYLFVLGLAATLATAQILYDYKETPATAKLKYNGTTQTTLYASVDEAKAEAKRVLDTGIARVDIVPTTITMTRVAFSSSSVASSSTAAAAKLLKPTAITASTTRDSNTAANVGDGDATTRWESAWQSDPQSIRLDLGASYALGNVAIDWEDACAESFTIEGSTNASTWLTLVTYTGGSFGARTDSLDVRGTYRYVRITGTKRPVESQWGYSIYEIRVTSAGASSTSSMASSASSANTSVATSQPPSGTLAVPMGTSSTITHPVAREDETTLPFGEISHYTIVREPAGGGAGISTKIPKQSTPTFAFSVPWDIYQGDTVKIFTWDTAGLHSTYGTQVYP